MYNQWNLQKKIDIQMTPDKLLKRYKIKIIYDII